MKTIVSPIFGLALMSGLVMAAPEYTMFKPVPDRPVTYYRRPLPPVCPAIEEEPRNITTELALKRRMNLWRKGLAIAQSEAMFYPSTPARVSGRVSAQPLPPPVFIQPVPMAPEPMTPEDAQPPPGAGLPLPPLPVKPPDFSNLNSSTEIPTAKTVEGRPGFVVSPYDPVTGYIDVNGMAPGSEMRDPYTGKIFRIP